MRYRYVVIALAAVIGIASAGCEVEDPDGEGAQVVESPAADEGATDTQAAEDTPDEPALGTRENPVPVGTTVEIGDWEVTLTDVTHDATQQVLETNEFNEEPSEGRQFVMGRWSAKYTGDDSGTFWIDMSTKFLGSGGNTFGESMEDDCGVIPEPIHDKGETFPDGTVEGNDCWSVPSDQVQGGAIIIEASFEIESDRVFFAVDEEGTDEAPSPEGS